MKTCIIYAINAGMLISLIVSPTNISIVHVLHVFQDLTNTDYESQTKCTCMYIASPNTEHCILQRHHVKVKGV